MYNSYFGLTSDPFRVNPDPRFLYFSESHREALATLVYTVDQRKGFIVLTGEVGTGKTTMLNALLRKLHPSVQTAFLFNTALSVEDFFGVLFDELELAPIEPFRKAEALRRLNEHLIDRLKRGKQTLLIIDEAQNLSAELLEEVRMLSNLETPQSKLIQIILVGQPELAGALERPELRQLNQRIELRHRISPLSVDDTMNYIRERLVIAGHKSGEVFTNSALRLVHRYARGIPRVTNVLCDNALLGAYSRKATRISAQVVKEAASEMGLTDFAPSATPKGAPPRGFWRRLWARPAAAELA